MPPNKKDDKDLERGKRLKKIRKVMKLTQTELGILAGDYPAGSVFNWESKGHAIPNNALLAMKEKGISLTYVLSGEGEMKVHQQKSPPEAGMNDDAVKLRLFSTLEVVHAALSELGKAVLDGTLHPDIAFQAALEALDKVEKAHRMREKAGTRRNNKADTRGTGMV